MREKLVLRIRTTIPTWKIWELASSSMAPRWLLGGCSVRGIFSIVRRYVVMVSRRETAEVAKFEIFDQEMAGKDIHLYSLR